MEIIKDQYAIYQGDSCQKMPLLPENKMGFMFYSPPFDDLYVYSSSIHDLGNNVNYDEFLQHYEFIVKESRRVLMPGRIVGVHCMDLPRDGQGGLIDFPGDIVRLHQANGFVFWDRKNIWKEPLRVAIRSRDRKLMHGQIVKDSTRTRGALADYILFFKKKGENEHPVSHPIGLTDYIGDFSLFSDQDKKDYLYLKKEYINYKDDKTNKLSQWIWRRYASSDWRDVNMQHVLEYKPAKEQEDERHVCPLNLDIIKRSLILYTNIGDTVLDPFVGIGSTVYSAVSLGRRGVGIELKESYYRQAVKNMESLKYIKNKQISLMDEV